MFDLMTSEDFFTPTIIDSLSVLIEAVKKNTSGFRDDQGEMLCIEVLDVLSNLAKKGACLYSNYTP